VTNQSSDLGTFQISYLGQTPQITVRHLQPATSTLKTTWSYLDNVHDRRPSGIANTGLTSGQYTNFTFETTPGNFIAGVTQESDASVGEPNPSAQTVSFNNLNEIVEGHCKVIGLGLKFGMRSMIKRPTDGRSRSTSA